MKAVKALLSSRLRRGSHVFVALLSLAGCASAPEPILPVTASRLAAADDQLMANDWTRYRGTAVPHLLAPSVCAGDARKTLFLVSFSGGGSRAAYFGARVLHELDKIGPQPLTPSIDGIFSVSGGSMTAALYALSGDRPDRFADMSARPTWTEQMTDAVLAKGLARSMAGELRSPGSLGGYLFGDLTRTDLLQRAIERDVFMHRGSSLTYKDLNPDRPPIFIVSAVATSEGELAFDPLPFGSPFLFSKGDLARIGDDLASVPLARAVTASAAFPGLLSPVTLPRYRRSTLEVQDGSKRYVHLIDGGNADNLGLLGVKRALLEDDHRLLRACENIVVLSVDAFGKQGRNTDDRPRERSPVGWFFDHNSALSSFDALLAANRARLLGEFKSRVFMPPGTEELCRKDGLPDDVCGGGVRADWGEINRLLKQKLFFVHLSFASPELAEQTNVTICHGDYGSADPKCEVEPVDGERLWCERRDLERRVAAIPTTFGLTEEEGADLRIFASLLNHSHNGCLKHLWSVVADGKQHTQAFYRYASASCDETQVLHRGEIPPAACHVRGRIFGDVIARAQGQRLSTAREECAALTGASHEERIRFLSAAKEKLEAAPQYLEGDCQVDSAQ